MQPGSISVPSPPPTTAGGILVLSDVFLTCVLSVSLLVKIPGPTMTSANRDRVENTGKTPEAAWLFSLPDK